MVFPIIVPIALELEGTTLNANWMASGWSLAGSIAFAIAGQTSDYFGRRYILLFGQALLILGHIIGATANSINQCIAAMVILGVSLRPLTASFRMARASIADWPQFWHRYNLCHVPWHYGATAQQVSRHSKPYQDLLSL